MEESERIAVELPHELAEELRHAVAAGEHATVGDAIEEAVEHWTAARLTTRIGIEQIRRHWDEGLASGDFRPLDSTDAMRRVEEWAKELRDESSAAS